MGRERNRVENLVSYIKTLGIDVNVAKNKARGNRGLFVKSLDTCRIDISKNISIEDQLSTLLHEFAHFLHYQKDAKLQSLDFVFDDLTEVEFEELLKVTVTNIPKNFAISLYEKIKVAKLENTEFLKIIKRNNRNLKLSDKNNAIEKSITSLARYFFKYDSFKIGQNIYNLTNLEKEFADLSEEQIAYIKYKVNQRKIRRLNAKINRLNKYYNQPSELWARFFELFCLNRSKLEDIAPLLIHKFQKKINNKSIPEINKILEIIMC